MDGCHGGHKKITCIHQTEPGVSVSSFSSVHRKLFSAKINYLSLDAQAKQPPPQSQHYYAIQLAQSVHEYQ